jgi:xanthine dehydrogenase small subunit
MRDRVRYLSNGETIEVAGFAPDAMLLDHLRLARGLTGTKEGCNEGDCGACTVAIGRLVDGRVEYQPVNACIQLLGQVDGAEVVTIEDLARREGRLHPLQDAMVRHHGSQCGFCTPGIVMSLFTLYQEEGPVGRQNVLDRLAGNLCRCTGYRPIVEAALEACAGREGGRPADAFERAAGDTAAKLAALATGDDLFAGTEQAFFAAPGSVAALADLYARHPDATILAGATDVGLWITKQLRRLPKIIHVGRVAELSAIRHEADGLVLGAAVTYAEAEDAVAAIDPDLGELWRRIGSKQVRASGTVGGNVANGSPIGDTPPALIALGARVELRRGAETRLLPLEDFFIAYGKQDRRPGEFVAALHVPALASDQRLRAMKLSKRFDQDISAVMAAFRLTLDGRTVTEARLVYGGMAGTPKRASGAEAAIVGASLDDASSWTPALLALGSDFVPLTDMRASAEYRRTTAIRLFEKALIEIAGADTATTRVVGIREGVHERVA